MKPFRFIALLFMAIPVAAYCQDICTLSGKVTDPDKQPVAAGEAYILNESDSSILKKAYILKGAFAFEPMVKGEYLLKISSQGFKDKLQLLVLDESKAVVITMEHSAALMQEVTVTGTTKTFVNKNGNTLVNVANSPLAAIPDAVTLLSRLPSVQVSPDGEIIALVGKGQPLIYVDNQKMTVQDLKSLAVSDIKTIELINDPSSRYEADGRAVILITRKTSAAEGWKAELAETAAYRRYYLNRSSANVTMRKKKLELKGNIQYNQLKTWEGNAIDFQIGRRHIDSKYSVTAVTTRPQFIAEAGAFYQINEGDYVSFSRNARTQKESFPIYTNSSLTDDSHEESVATSTFNNNPNLYYTSRLNYNHRISKGSLFVGLQQTGFHKDMKTVIFNDYDNTGSALSQNRRQTTAIRVLAGRIDFDKNFASGKKLEIGTAATRAASQGLSDIRNYHPDGTLNAVFSYRETNYAAYSQLSGKLEKISYAAGFRLENTTVASSYDNRVAPSIINKQAARLFPKTSVVIPIDSVRTLTLKYAKTIVRPDYSNANKTAVYINPYFEWTNNIDLDPAVTDEVSATFQVKDFSLAMSLYQSRGAVYANFNYDDNETRLTRTDINYDRENGGQLTLTIPFRYRIWSSTNVMSAVLSSIKDPAAASGRSKPFLYCYTSNEFKLPANFTFTLSGWAVTRSYQGAYERNALFSVDTSLNRSFGKNFSGNIRFNNMFASINSREKLLINDVSSNGIFYDNSREFAIALKYFIGKLKESRYQVKEIDEDGNRVK